MKQPLHNIIWLMAINMPLDTQLNAILNKHDIYGCFSYYGPIWETVHHQCLLLINGFCLQ